MTAVGRRLEGLWRRRWVRSIFAAALTAVAGVVVFGGGGSGDGGAGGGGGRDRGRAAPRHGLATSVAAAYSSLRALSGASSSLALLTATGSATRQTVGGIPLTVTQMTVQETVAGATLPATIGLAQIGAAGDAGTDVVQSGDVYLAYLTPYENRDGPVAGQWTIVGGQQGLYLRSSAVGTFPPETSRVFTQDAASGEPTPPGLPRTISIAQARSSYRPTAEASR